MAVSRFVFLARRADGDGADDRRDDISWLLVSSNSRPLGRAVRWHDGLDGNPVAEASRVYVRQYECDYNMRRFLEALPVADIPSTVRMVRRGSDGRPCA